MAKNNTSPHLFLQSIWGDGRAVDSRLRAVVLVLFFLAVLPFAALLIIALGGFDTQLWGHLNRSILWPIIASTVWLLLGVGLMVTMIGVLTAWVVTVCRFPGRRLLAIALLLPLALPTYVSAFAYIEFLGFSGPLQSAIRAIFGFQSVRDYWFPDYRSVSGAVFVMSVVLYPYVYLTSRAAFALQTASAFDACRTLGSSPVNLFFRVALPMARPAIVVGASLALMETANDVGAVEFFGVQTLTTLIYDTWLNRASLATSAQLAIGFLTLVLLLLWLERHGRRAQKLFETSAKTKFFKGFELRGLKAFGAIVLCALPVFLGFVIPALVLAESAIVYALSDGLAILVKPLSNTLFLAVIATTATMLAAAFIAYLSNLMPSKFNAFMVRLITLGYAVPGVILAIGVLIPLAAFDNGLDGLMNEAFGIKTGLLLSGTTFALIYAYGIRFLPMAHGALETGFQRLSPNYNHAARTLGRGVFRALREVHVPLLNPALVSGALMVFVDCMKELPATLLLRPFNFDTLATAVYNAASLEVFEEGALPAIAIILVGLIPVVLLSLQENRKLKSAD